MFEPKNEHPSPEATSSVDALALLAAKGDEESFSRLVGHFSPVLMALIRSLSISEADFDDFKQEGLIALYKAVRLFDPKLSSFSTFARICMRSALADCVRKQSKYDAIDLTEFSESLSASDTQIPERIFIGKETLAETLARVDRLLSPMERRIFGLSLQGKSTAEIALLTGKDKKSVANTLYRVRKKLSDPV